VPPLDNRGRAKGSPKVGGAKKGSVKTHTIAVKEAVMRVFNEVNENDDYLHEIAVEDRKLFLSLLARLIPTQLDIEQKVTFDLGAAMVQADAHVGLLSADATPVIDVTPVTHHYPELLAPRLPPSGPDTVVVEATPEPEPDPWPGY